MNHFLSDALAQVTILLYYNIKSKDGTIALNQGLRFKLQLKACARSVDLAPQCHCGCW